MSAPPLPPLPRRPMLKPALRRLWRDPATLQLGVEATHARVLAGLDPEERALLDLLDGSRACDAVVADAAELGVPASRAHTLVNALAAAGVLDEGERGGAVDEHERQRLEPDRLALSLRHRGAGGAEAVLRRRRESSVELRGTGRVGASLATLLAAAGVGEIACVDDAPVSPADAAPAGITGWDERGRGAAALAAVRRAAPRARRSAKPLGAPTLTVVAPTGPFALPEHLTEVRARPHLLVGIRETAMAIGPFVVPGRTSCLRCLELWRASRDPQWPTLAAQLATGGRRDDPCDIVLATFAAALAALHVLTWLDSVGATLPPSADGVVEYDPADGRLRRRSVQPHPGCGCAGAGAA